MMHIHRYFILACLAMAGVFTALRAQQPDHWIYRGEKEGIKIYHQKTPGMLHIKLSTSVKVPLSGIAALFSDVDHYSDWGYKISESHLLKRNSPNDVWFYAKYDFPWPMEDRDVILHSQLEQDPSTRNIRILNTAYPEYLPENEGIVRIKNTTTRWNIIPGDGGWVYIEQQISTDSAEGLPDWVIKLTADTGPFETAKNLRRLLSGVKYQTVRLAHIKE